jgi:CheY-like chemotaxis protein
MTQHTVLLYSDDPEIRDRMRMAIGSRPAADLSVKFVDASTYAEVVKLVDDTDVDLLVLDGEATPGGGLGIARQLKDEITDPPPVVLAIARAADRWLASYARVEGTIMYPLDPVITGKTVSDLLRSLAVQG